MAWPRLVFGRLVEFAGGPVQARAGFERLGRSPGFPEGLLRACQPNEFGLGAPLDQIVWDDLSWRDRGGLVQRLVTVEGADWVVVGRIAAGVEGGTTGRFYPKICYVAMTAAEWTPRHLLSLGETLGVSDLTERSDDLPPLKSPPIQEQALPTDWLDRINVPLSAVVSGHSYCEQITAPDLEAALETVCLVMTALPHSVAVRLPVGVGLADSTGTALSAARTARAAVRYIQGTIRGHDKLNLGSGDRYVAWLREAGLGCHTWSDVAAVVGAIDFRSARRQFAGAWPEVVTSLREAFDDYQVRQSIQAFVDRLDQGLARELPRLQDAEAKSLLCDVLKQRSSPASQGLLRMLSGNVGADSIAPLRFLNVADESLQQQLIRDALAAVERATSGARWAAIAAVDPADATWLHAWRRQAQPVLRRLAIEDRVSGDDALWTKLDDPIIANATYLLAGESLDPGKVAEVAQALGTVPTASRWIAAELDRRGHVYISVLFEETGPTKAGATDKNAVRRATALAGELLRSPTLTMNEGHVGLLTEQWHAIPTALKEESAFVRRVATALGAPWSRLLLGIDAPAGTTRTSRTGAQAFRVRAVENPSLIGELFGWLSGTSDSDVSRVLAAALASAAVEAGPVDDRMFRGLPAEQARGLRALVRLAGGTGPIRVGDVPAEPGARRAFLQVLAAFHGQCAFSDFLITEPDEVLLVHSVLPETASFQVSDELVQACQRKAATDTAFRGAWTVLLEARHAAFVPSSRVEEPGSGPGASWPNTRLRRGW